MFLPIVLGMYFLTKESYRNVLLLAASLFFYAWGEPVYVLVMILSIVINYICGLKIGTEDETKRKRALVGGIVINLALLGVFKYSGFFMENVNAVFGLEVEVKKLPLPIGISFYTFQSISYLVDIYRRVCPPQKSLIKMGLFISFFPQLIAGPILKYYDIAAQIDNRKVSLPLFNQGAVRFLQGLAKKIIIANIMAKTADEIFALGINDISTPMAWIGIVAYTFQIYFDFSGYSDIAIGTAKLLGIKLMKNFDYPYISRNIAEFWRRWHISLTTWFRDYIYIPLGGSRVGKWKSVRNTFIIFLVSGFWHGANWTFICWGLFHALLFLPLLLTSSNRKYRGIVAEGKLLPSWKEAIQIGTTFFLVVIGWILFRAENMEQAIGYIGRLFSMQQSTGNMPSHSLEVGLYILLFWILEWFQRDKPYALQIQFLKSKSLRVAILTFVILFIEITMGKSSEFIYFQF